MADECMCSHALQIIVKEKANSGDPSTASSIKAMHHQLVIFVSMQSCGGVQMSLQQPTTPGMLNLPDKWLQNLGKEMKL